MAILAKNESENNELKYTMIPSELKKSKLWGCYKLVDKQDGKKPSKVPKNPCDGSNARINDVSSFSYFEQCKEAAINQHYDGLVFAFGHDAELVGIDLDHVLDEKGDFINADAKATFDHFKAANAHIEKSPSLTGLRIICKKKPETVIRFGKGTDLKNFEMYGSGEHGLHFLSVTGNAYYEIDSIPYCDEALQWFNNSYFFEKPITQRAIQSTWEYSPELSNSEIIEKLQRSKRKNDFISLYTEGSNGLDKSADDIKLWVMVKIKVIG